MINKNTKVTDTGVNYLHKKHLIIVPSYQRIQSTEELLVAIGENEHKSHFDVLVSVDKPPTLKIENAFIELFNQQQVQYVIRSTNLGLKKHIFTLMIESLVAYETITIIEDDILISKKSLEYTLAAIKFFTKTKDVVPCLSLYCPSSNEFNFNPFTPIRNGMENFFMQVPSSWGQTFFTSELTKFFRWLAETPTDQQRWSSLKMPRQVEMWSSQSWKLDYYRYIVSKNLFVCYPYNSHSTNRGIDIGTHHKDPTFAFDVTLASCDYSVKECNFVDITRGIKYDPFFELIVDDRFSSVNCLDNNLELEFNINGLKTKTHNMGKDYIINIVEGKNLKRINAEKSFPCIIKPYELNIFDSHIKNPVGTHLVITKMKDFPEKFIKSPLLHYINTNLFNRSVQIEIFLKLFKRYASKLIAKTCRIS